MKNSFLLNKLLADRTRHEDSLAEWKDYALELLESGVDTENIRILAGIELNTNRFESDQIVSYVIADLNIDTNSEEQLIDNYIQSLAQACLSGQKSKSETLEILRRLCVEYGYHNRLFPFYLLAYAKSDLEQFGDQHYWDGATLENIDSIIISELNNLDKNSWTDY